MKNQPVATSLRLMPLLALMLALGIPLQAEAKKLTVADMIPTLGRTTDGKYNIYNLQGELDDLSYATIEDGYVMQQGKLVRQSLVYQPDDLLGRMDFISVKDLNKNGYRCDFVCKDAQGHIVGLNPQRKWMLKK